MNMINYSLLGAVSKRYETEGFSRIETPWWVTEPILNITKPEHVEVIYKIEGKDKCLVASGEQSFLYMINKGQLAPGKYQTITPCFRDEIFDAYHSKYFMKLELIHVREPGSTVLCALTDMVESVRRVLHPYIKGQYKFIQTDQYKHDKTIVPGTSYDLVIELGGELVELGSYGVRHCPFATWIYGTGLAEPRFTKVINELDYLRKIDENS